MSYITDVILTLNLAEEDFHIQKTIDQLNSWLIAQSCGYLSRVDEHAGGYKVSKTLVFLGVLNCLNMPQFIQTIKGLPWKKPCSIGLFVKEEQDDKFTEIIINWSN